MENRWIPQAGFDWVLAWAKFIDTDPMLRFIQNWVDRCAIAQASITPAEWDAAFAALF